MSETSLVGERAVLLDYLGHYRSALEAVCADLDEEQMAQQSVPPSNLSLLGLVRHLARVERAWFFRTMQHHPDDPKLYWTAEQPDLDFEGAVADPACVEDAWTTWRREVAAAEDYLETAPSLDAEGDHHGDPIELREVLVHLIEEYARHLGHADLIRECIDGRTGL
ncbi:MAG: DinB family protein [Marmoricola sp.]